MRIIKKSHHRYGTWIEWQLSPQEWADCSYYHDWFDASREAAISAAKEACDEQALTKMWCEFAAYAAEHRAAEAAHAAVNAAESDYDRLGREATEDHYDKRHDGF